MEQDPDANVEGRGQLELQENQHERQLRPSKEHSVERNHARNGATGPDGGSRGTRDDRIEKTSRDSGEKIESQEGAPAQNVLDVVTQNPEEVHVAEQMSRVQMVKLRCHSDANQDGSPMSKGSTALVLEFERH